MASSGGRDFAPAACLTAISAGVKGEGNEILSTLARPMSKFSCELGGSGASLLGTGVILDFGGLLTPRELDFLDSRRYAGLELFAFEGLDLAWDESAAGPAEAALAKNPRMLCCLPDGGAEPAFGVLELPKSRPGVSTGRCGSSAMMSAAVDMSREQRVEEDSLDNSRHFKMHQCASPADQESRQFEAQARLHVEPGVGETRGGRGSRVGKL
jgi:hypothetical protein